MRWVCSEPVAKNPAAAVTLSSETSLPMFRSFGLLGHPTSGSVPGPAAAAQVDSLASYGRIKAGQSEQEALLLQVFARGSAKSQSHNGCLRRAVIKLPLNGGKDGIRDIGNITFVLAWN